MEKVQVLELRHSNFTIFKAYKISLSFRFPICKMERVSHILQGEQKHNMKCYLKPHLGNSGHLIIIFLISLG